MNEDVCVKIYERDFDGLEEALKIYQSLDHPVICPCLKAGKNYVVMKRIHGFSLDQQKLGRRNLYRLAYALLDLLSYLDALKLCHNDIKPANLMMANKRFYLVDFDTLMPCQSTRTRLGSLAYASPEYRQGQAVSWQSDLYSLALCLKNLERGYHPFLNRWIKKALRHDPKKRFKTPKQAKRALDTRFLRLMLCVCLMLWGFYMPVKKCSFQAALAAQDYACALAIDEKAAYLKMSFEKAWENGLARVKDEKILSYWLDQISFTKDHDKQLVLLANLGGAYAQKRKAVIADPCVDNLVSLWQVSKTRKEKEFCLRCFPYYFQELEEGWEKTFLSFWNEGKDVDILIKAAYETRSDALFICALEYTEKSAYANICLALFANGHYQEGFLEKAENAADDDLEGAAVLEKIRQYQKQFPAAK